MWLNLSASFLFWEGADSNFVSNSSPAGLPPAPNPRQGGTTPGAPKLLAAVAASPGPRPAQTLLLVVTRGPGLIHLNNVWGDYYPGLPEIEGFPRRRGREVAGGR